nr:uncharacterized protein LOC127333435 [Lolium perenne]
MAWRWIWGRWGFTSPRECKPPRKKVQGRLCLGPRAPPAAAEEAAAAAAAAALKPGVPSSRTLERFGPRHESSSLSLSLLPQICLRCFLAADCSAGASEGDALYAAMASGGGAVREVGSRAELDAAVGGARPAAVHLWASWCEASKQMDEVLAHLAVDFLRITYFCVLS